MKHIILSLIKDDITNTRFIEGLNNLGLSADDQTLDLQYSIFFLVGIEKEYLTDELCDWYFNRVREPHQKRLKGSLDSLAESIYNHLAAFSDAQDR